MSRGMDLTHTRVLRRNKYGVRVWLIVIRSVSPNNLPSEGDSVRRRDFITGLRSPRIAGDAKKCCQYLGCFYAGALGGSAGGVQNRQASIL